MVWNALLLLVLLGLVLMLIVRQSISRITRTPWWLLWLALMIPAFVIGLWYLTQGAQQSVPLPLMVAAFFVSTLLYFYLLQRGRILPLPPPSASNNRDNLGEASPTDKLSQPQALAPAVRLIDKTEEGQLRDCFPWSTFYLQEVEVRPQAVICRGQLRAQPETAYHTIRDQIADKFGERYLLIFQNGAADKPFFALVPNPQAPVVDQADLAGQTVTKPAAANLNRPGLALLLLVATLFTTTAAGAKLANPALPEQALFENLSKFLEGLPYALSLIAILGVHELGHYFTARFYKLRSTLPYFVPLPFLFGTIGAFTLMRSPIPNRRTLFDYSIAGPVAGLVITLPLLLWGLSQSQVVPIPTQPAAFAALQPNFSILLLLLSKLMLGAKLTANSALNLHPLAITGCLGLLFTSVNLMPVGQLDGGHIVHAMYGQRGGAMIGQITRVLTLLLALLQPWLLFWAIFLLFIPAFDEPTLNDVTELDNRRDFWGLVALAFLLVIILPAPAFLTNWLLAG